jgi:hypothetical protein
MWHTQGGSRWLWCVSHKTPDPFVFPFLRFIIAATPSVSSLSVSRLRLFDAGRPPPLVCSTHTPYAFADRERPLSNSLGLAPGLKNSPRSTRFQFVTNPLLIFTENKIEFPAFPTILKNRLFRLWSSPTYIKITQELIFFIRLNAFCLRVLNSIVKLKHGSKALD